MDSNYSFLSEEEPTEEQLNELMHEVLISVKERAMFGDEKLNTAMKEEIKKNSTPLWQGGFIDMDLIKPKLLIVAGPNGSGKTSITWKILKHEWVEGCVYINPDEIARDKFGDWNLQETVIMAANYAKELREDCLFNDKSLLFETVMSALDKVDYIMRAKEKGYFIRLFFVGTDHPSINASRITHRVLEGGHDVPISKIVSRYSKSIANCCEVVNLVDRAYIYDNSIDYAEPKLLFRVRDRSIEKVYNPINSWAKNILDYVGK